MRIPLTNVLAGSLFVAIVAVTVHAGDPVPCATDGWNWATINEACSPNEQLRTCAQLTPSGDPLSCGFVFTKRYNGNYVCYASEAIGGQTTTCVRPKNPDGTNIEQSCLDHQMCVPQNNGGLFPDWVCVPAGNPVTQKREVWTNVACVVAPPPPPPKNP